MITGLDLVQLQLLIAEGAPLPEEARHPVVRGHAIEARLYAEDPSDDYRPAPGPVHAFRVPPDAGARVDSGVEDGTVVSPFYDPMLAKVVAHENDRAAALRSLRWTLRNARIHGTRTNRHLLVAILEHPEFQAGDIDTGFLDRHPPADLVSARASRDELRLAAIAAVLAARASSARDASVLASVPAGWRNNRSQLQTRTYETAAITLTVGYAFDRAPRIEVDGEAVPCEVVQTSPDAVVLVVDGVRRRFEVSQIGDVVYVDSARSNVQLREVPRFPELDADLPTGSLIAPMPATVARVTVGAGERVAAGALLIVLEAMKMEHQIVAPVAGIVTAVHVAVGDAVDRGTVLAVLDEEGAS
jgi:acetyl/propionyl-CoA carboxylase alpha subunit